MKALIICHAYQSEPQCHLFISRRFLLSRFAFTALTKLCCMLMSWLLYCDPVWVMGWRHKKGWNGRWTRTEDM